MFGDPLLATSGRRGTVTGSPDLGAPEHFRRAAVAHSGFMRPKFGAAVRATLEGQKFVHRRPQQAGRECDKPDPQEHDEGSANAAQDCDRPALSAAWRA